MEAIDDAVRDSARHDALPAHARSSDDATRKDAPAPADSSAIDAVSTENPCAAPDAAPQASIADDRVTQPTPNEGDASASDAASATTAPSVVCRVCSRSGDDDLRVCAGCGVAVHASCYGESTHATSESVDAHQQQNQELQHKGRHQEGDTNAAAAASENEKDADASAAWTCDCCAHSVASVRDLQCVFCEQPAGELVVKHVDTQLWSPPPAMSSESFAHVLCSRWDPHAFQYVVGSDTVDSVEDQDEAPPPLQQVTRGTRKLASEARQLDAVDAPATPDDVVADATSTAAEEQPSSPPPAATTAASTTTPPVFDYALSLPTPCCFCESSRGIRIQCQRLDCGRFFHVMCAHTRAGLVEIRPSPRPSFVQYHAYCSRHRTCADNASTLLRKLLSKPIGALTSRDTTVRLQAVRRRLDAHAFESIDAFLRAIATVLVDLYKKGLRASKADPPVPNTKHLQALQFFVDHVAQLRVVYRASPHARLTLGDDSDAIYDVLQKTFDPTKYLGKFAGPVTPAHVCHVCKGPFQARQHVFYCTHATTPHAQHWKCTKRRSNSREREKIAAKVAATTGHSSSSGSGSAKKKLKSFALVVNGQWRDVKLPKGLPGVSDGIICSICRCDVDASGVIASRKEGKRAEFEKKASRFVLGGCYVNASALPKPSSAGARPPLASKTESSKSLGVAKVAASDRSRGKRSANDATSASAATASSATTGGKVAPGAATLETVAAASAAPVALGPPKMERINVQRTTKWLAYVAQIIRLAGAVAKLPKEPATDSERIKDEPMDSTVLAAPARALEQEAVTPAPVAAPETATQPDTTPAALVAAAAETTAPRPAAAPLTSDTPVTAAAPTAAAPVEAPAASSSQTEVARLSRAIDAYFDEALQIVRPFDAYVVSKLETARAYLRDRTGPGVGVLRMLAHEYTRFMYIKHTRAVEKAANEKRKREEQEALEHKERTRKRLEREAEEAHKNQLLAMRQKKRKLGKIV